MASSDRKRNNVGTQLKICNFDYFLIHGKVFEVTGFQRWVYLGYLQFMKHCQ